MLKATTSTCFISYLFFSFWNRNEQNPQQKASLTSEFHEYIGRAEAIKSQLSSSNSLDPSKPPSVVSSQNNSRKEFNDARDYTEGRYQAQRKETGSNRNPFMLPKKCTEKGRSSDEFSISPSRSESDAKQTSTASSQAKKKKRKYTQYEATVITDMLDRAPPTGWDDIKVIFSV